MGDTPTNPQYPPWWHEGTAKPGEALTGVIRDQRDHSDQFGEYPIYETELLEPADLTVGETINKEWTVSTRQFAAGELVTVKAKCAALMAELAVRAPVKNGERVNIAYFGKRDPSEQTSPHRFKVKKLDRAGVVNRAKYAAMLEIDIDGEPSAPKSDIPDDVVVGGGGPAPADDIPFSPVL